MGPKAVTQIQKVCTAFGKPQQWTAPEKVSGQPGGWSGCPETFSGQSHCSVFRKAVQTFEISSHSVTGFRPIWHHFRYSFRDVHDFAFRKVLGQFGGTMQVQIVVLVDRQLHTRLCWALTPSQDHVPVYRDSSSEHPIIRKA